MPKYTAKAYLYHRGKLVKTDEELELTNEQAKRLGDKVSIVAGSEVTDSSQEHEKTLDDYNVEQLKEIAKEYEIEGYSTMKKADLVKAIEARQ